MKRIFAFCMALVLMMSVLAFGASAKVYALTMGVHKYGANNTVSDGSDIATVTYFRHKDESTGTQNKIYDIEFGEVFTLTTAVKEGKENEYVFCGWLNQDGEIISTSDTITLTFDGSKTAIAVYAESASRYVLTYLVQKGEGSLSVSSNRPLYQGDECVSIFGGADATIKFTPGKGYSVRYIRVNGRDQSFVLNNFDTMESCLLNKDIKGFFNGFLNLIKYLIHQEATFTIRNIEADTLFEIGFSNSIL